MRKIKFRAFNEKKKLMLSYEDLLSGGENILIDSVKGSGEFFVLPLTEIKLMQYTGLKDKNDIEIYEGDLIQFITEPDVYKIDWSGVYLQYHIFSKYGKNVMDLAECESFEIVGNIYENPELLEQ